MARAGTSWAGLIAIVVLGALSGQATAQSILPPIINGDFDMEPPLFAWESALTERGGGAFQARAGATVEDASGFGGDGHALRMSVAVSIPRPSEPPVSEPLILAPPDTSIGADDFGAGTINLPYDAVGSGHARSVVSQTFGHMGGQTVVAAIAWSFRTEISGDALADLWLRMQVDNLMGGQSYVEVPLNIAGSGNPCGGARSLSGVAGWREYRIDLSSIETILCEQYQVSFELVAIAHIASAGSQVRVMAEGWIDHVRIESEMDQLAALPMAYVAPADAASYPAISTIRPDNLDPSSFSSKDSMRSDQLTTGIGDFSDGSTAPRTTQGDCGTPSFFTLAKGDNSSFGLGYALPPERCAVVSIIRDRCEWAEFWAAHLESYDPAPRPPYVEFSSHSVVAILSGERPTGCYAIELNNVLQAPGKTRLEIVEFVPGEGQGCSDATTRPFHFALLPNAFLDAGQEVVLKYRTVTAALD